MCIYIYTYIWTGKKKLPAGRATYMKRVAINWNFQIFPSHGFPRDGEATFQGRPFLDVPLKVVFIQAIHCCSLYGHPSIFVNGITYLSAGYRISSISSTQRRFGDSGPFPWDLTHWDILLTIILWKGIAIQSKNDDPTRIIHGSDRN